MVPWYSPGTGERKAARPCSQGSGLNLPRGWRLLVREAEGSLKEGRPHALLPGLPPEPSVSEGADTDSRKAGTPIWADGRRPWARRPSVQASCQGTRTTSNPREQRGAPGLAAPLVRRSTPAAAAGCRPCGAAGCAAAGGRTQRPSGCGCRSALAPWCATPWRACGPGTGGRRPARWPAAGRR